MKLHLHLIYCSSDDGVKLIRLFKYIRHSSSSSSIETEYELTYEKNDLCVMELRFSPANKSIYGYDNIRAALKSVFPTLFDLTPTKRMPIEYLRIDKGNIETKLRNSRHQSYFRDKGLL